MKLLFDQNLSPKLVTSFTDLFPASKHVLSCGLDKATDVQLWNYALENNFTIVTKDTDFNDRAELFGHPPRVIWIKRENCSTKVIEDILRTSVQNILDFEKHTEMSVLVLV